MARADDEGTIFEYPKGSGVWWAQLPADAQGKRPKRRATTQKEALEKLRELWAERENGVDASLKQPTVKAFLSTWLNEIIKPKKSLGTFENYSREVRLYIELHSFTFCAVGFALILPVKFISIHVPM